VGSKTGVACASDDTSSSFRNNLKISSFSSLRQGLKLGQMDAAEMRGWKRGKEGKWASKCVFQLSTSFSVAGGKVERGRKK
jgi:hypothetical protein